MHLPAKPEYRNQMKGGNAMLLDICKTHRKRYGCLIRQKRLQSGYTQKELIEELHHAVSLRQLYRDGKWKNLTGYGAV